MALKIRVARDYEHMSDIAAELFQSKAAQVVGEKQELVLGLATGNSPVGMYERLARAANSGKIDSSVWRTFNLDEYVGLAGAAGSPHPDSYRHFMDAHLFSRLYHSPIETCLPPGERVQSAELLRELMAFSQDWHSRGKISGKAIVIRKSPDSPYLNWIRTQVLMPFEESIRSRGGIDLQVLGVGGRGHVAFHEAGIPFELKGLLLVELDEVTREHAVTDGYFPSLELCPRFALTMSIDLVFQARAVLVLANGPRKRDAISASLLQPPTDEMPMSYAQIHAARGGDITFVLDQEAAEDLLHSAEVLEARGYALEDCR